MAQSPRHRPPTSTSGRRLLSACLIVKDEEAVIARCITSLLPLVDEVVVHDTGSSDRTVEICRDLGARVIEGEWRDDFAWARNVGIEAARTEWVLVIDADEELVGTNFAGLRRLLREGDLDAYRAQVHNAQDMTGNISVTHSSIRLFRQRLFRYSGRIHEQVTSIASHRVRVDKGEMIELRHWGYLPAVMKAKNKADRNIHLAEVSHQEEQSDKSVLETARARSLGEDHEGTLERLEMIRESEDPEIRHTALQIGVQTLVKLGRPDQALEWLEKLLALGRTSALTTYLHGYTLMQFQRYEEAIEVLGVEHDDAASMVHGITHSSDGCRALLARALSAVGKEEEGLAVYLEVAATGPLDLWPDLLRVLYLRNEMHRAVPAFTTLEAEADGRRLRGTLAILTTCPIEVGDAFAEALYQARPDDIHALAFISMVGHELELERAIIWSTRAREAGLTDSCALLRQVEDLRVPPTQRITAAAVLMQAFSDQQAADGLVRAALDLPDEDVTDALFVVGELAPVALESLVLGVVTSQARALVMATSLSGLQAHEQAAEVLRLALDVHEDTEEATPKLVSLLNELDPAEPLGV